MMSVMTITTAEPLPHTADRAVKLIAASERRTLDPFVDIDWDIAIDDSAFHLPPEWLPLYGTAAWDVMDEPARIAYSRHEQAAVFGAGIWFENMLMQIVLRHLAEIPVTSPLHRYLLIEVADECRHSAMFGEYIRRAGTPAYAPPSEADTVGTLMELPGGRALGYLLILAVEEILDVINRATMKDDRVHPLARQIAKLHVLEEARHVSFAKSYLSEVWPTLDDAERAHVVELAPEAVSRVVGLVIDGAVYDELRIDGGAETARSNPHYQARIVEGLTSLTEFLIQLGVINDEARPTWVEQGLAARL
jgi:hypothetical protein